MRNDTPCFVLLAADEGNLNIGDQAMYVNVCRRLKRHFPKCRIVAVGRQLGRSVDVAGVDRVAYGHEHFSSAGGRMMRWVERLPKGVRLASLIRYWFFLCCARTRGKWYHRLLWNRDCRDAVEMLASADLVLSCGGGYLTSLWWREVLWVKCALYCAASILGKPVVLSGQGIGPVTARLDRWVLKMGLCSADFVGLREEGEAGRYLAALGIPEDKFAVTGDDAVDLPTCGQGRLSEILEAEGIDLDRPVLVANFRSTAYSHRYVGGQYQRFGAVLDQLVEKHRCQIVFVPFCYDEDGRADDRTAAFDVTKHMRNRNATRIVMGRYTPEEIKGLVSIGEIAVGVSYHFAVFSLTQGIPCLTLFDNEYYRMKFTGLYGHFGCRPWHFAMDDAGVDALLTEVDTVLCRHAQEKSDLLGCTCAMVQRVDSVYDRIEALLSRKESRPKCAPPL